MTLLVYRRQRWNSLADPAGLQPVCRAFSATYMKEREEKTIRFENNFQPREKSIHAFIFKEEERHRDRERKRGKVGKRYHC